MAYGYVPVTSVNVLATPPSPILAGSSAVAFQGQAVGGSGTIQYRFVFWNGASWAVVQNWSTVDTWTMPITTPAGAKAVQVQARADATSPGDATRQVSYTLQ